MRPSPRVRVEASHGPRSMCLRPGRPPGAERQRGRAQAAGPPTPTREVTMTSATIKPASGAGGRHAEGRGYGLIVFASILLFVDGFFNMLYGIAAIANSHVFVANAHYVIGDLRAWGWITLIIAILQLAAGGGVLAGNQLARWFAVAVVGISAIDMMFFLPAYPFW